MKILNGHLTRDHHKRNKDELNAADSSRLLLYLD